MNLEQENRKQYVMGKKKVGMKIMEEKERTKKKKEQVLRSKHGGGETQMQRKQHIGRKQEKQNKGEKYKMTNRQNTLIYFLNATNFKFMIYTAIYFPKGRELHEVLNIFGY